MYIIKYFLSKNKHKNFRNFREIKSCDRPLISHYVHSVLSSRLLLDEDMTIVIRNYNSRAYGGAKENTCWYYVVPAFWAFAVCAEVQFFNPAPYYTLPFALLSCMLQWRRGYYRWKRKKNINDVLNGFTRLHKLNLAIVNYLKVREILSVMHDSPKHVVLELHEFLTATFEEEIEFLMITVASVRQMYYYVDSELVFPQNWFTNKLQNLKLVCLTEEHCEKNFQTLRDLGILISSNFLGCLGVIMCPESWKNHPPDISFIVNKMIPKIKKRLLETVNLLETKFDSLRFTIRANEEFNKELEKSKYNKYVKIDRPLVDFLSQMQVAFELGVELRKKLIKNPSNLDVLDETVQNLREHVSVCDKFLEAFRKSYGLMIKKAIDDKPKPQTTKTVTFTEETPKNPPPILETPSQSEEQQYTDEEYELYLTGDDQVGANSPDVADKEPISDAYLTSMLDELKARLQERQSQRTQSAVKKCVIGKSENTLQKTTTVIHPNESKSAPLPTYICADTLQTSHFADLLKKPQRSTMVCGEDVFEDE